MVVLHRPRRAGTRVCRGVALRGGVTTVLSAGTEKYTESVVVKHGVFTFGVGGRGPRTLSSRVATAGLYGNVGRPKRRAVG